MSVINHPVAHATDRNSGVRWIILGFIFVASFVSYLLRTNLSIVGETMIADLGMTEIQLGAAFSAFALGYAAFQFPGGLLGDWIGPRKALTLIAVAWGVLTIATGLLPSSNLASTGLTVAVLVLIRFLVGAFHAPIFPVTGGGMVSNWFPVGHWGLPNGLSSTGLTLGAAATGPLLVWLVEVSGWRQSFFLTAPIAFLLAAAWWRYTRDDPAEHAGVSQSELDLIHAGQTAREEEPKADWLKVLGNRDILLLTVSYFCMNYVFYLFFNWFFFYLVEVRGFSPEAAGYLTASLWIVGAVGATLGGLTCDRIIRRMGLNKGSRVLPMVGLIGSAILLLAGAMASDSRVTVALLAVCFGFNQITEAAFWSTAIAVGGRHAASASGVMNTGGNLVGAVGGLLVPFTAQLLGWVAAISTGALFALVGAAIWLRIRADRPMAQT